MSSSPRLLRDSADPGGLPLPSPPVAVPLGGRTAEHPPRRAPHEHRPAHRPPHPGPRAPLHPERHGHLHHPPRRPSPEAQRGRPAPVYIDVVTFGPQAEAIAQYMAQGRRVAVVGRLEYREWTDDQGGRHSKHEVIAHQVDFSKRPGPPTIPRPTTAPTRSPSNPGPGGAGSAPPAPPGSKPG